VGNGIEVRMAEESVGAVLKTAGKDYLAMSIM